jgi:hypothetical protein
MLLLIVNIKTCLTFYNTLYIHLFFFSKQHHQKGLLFIFILEVEKQRLGDF